MRGLMITVDGNEAAALVAHRFSEVIAIYPITPSSSMGELSDEWSSKGRTNLWGVVPEVVELQSEAGAIGTVHGALLAGSMATTFTASQGLLLMIPNLFKIAGELTPFVVHVAARTVATHALSIFGDHSDVMACRPCGLAMLASGSVQEAYDFALIAHVATLRSRVPFMHFFDGFRTSHEVAKIEALEDDDLRALLPEEDVAAHRRRGLRPERPVIRGTAQNPDSFFQAREAGNRFTEACPDIVQETMEQVFERTGRRYQLFDYDGAPDAERVLVIMGSGGQTALDTVQWLQTRGEKVGLIRVRLYRPFHRDAFLACLPQTVRSIAVLDRTKEPGAVGEPLYQDVVVALSEGREDGVFAGNPRVVGGRYGLSSKEFTPAMIVAVFGELSRERPKNHFTIGIHDDVTHTSLPWDEELDIEPDDVKRGVFFGLGADGTVGANKNSIKIIGEETSHWAQGYFVYDSKKSGSFTISHLRFGPRAIRSAYLVKNADFVACHQFSFLDKLDVLSYARPGAVFLLNSHFAPDRVWSELPREVQERCLEKHLRFYVIDAYRVARDAGMGNRINTIMQTCWFAVSGVLPRDEAIGHIKHSIEKTYGKRGAEVVASNFAAVDATLAGLYEVPLPATVSATRRLPPVVSADAPDFVQRVTAVMLADQGDHLPVSAFPVDGTWPTGTARWEKRNIARDIPVWDEALCIQCNKCALVCPHAAVRVKVYGKDQLGEAPATFKQVPYRGKEWEGSLYTVQVAPEDCTGCTLCVAVCPAKDKANPRHKALDMAPHGPLRAPEAANWEHFLALPEADRTKVRLDVKGAQFLQPLFEFSGACSGCGETPYVKLLTQLFGDRLLIANATGCSSIYGGNLPTTPYTTDRHGRGPAWANSLFEDNAEFGLGLRLAADAGRTLAQTLVRRLAGTLPGELVTALLEATQGDEAGIAAQRERVVLLRHALAGREGDGKVLSQIADDLVQKSVWIVGGDGWAYDIGYGGLDHVLSTGRKVNILVLDTEVYSNTGGQQSKATPMGASAKFAVAGKAVGKKDLGLMAMAYRHVYVAQIAFGSKDLQATRAFLEAEAHPGPSLIIAYSHCIAHGYDLAFGLEQQKLAVETGYWPLYRYEPMAVARGENPLHLDSQPPKGDLGRYMRNETRFRLVEQAHPDRFRQLLLQAQRDVHTRFALYKNLADAAVGTDPKKNGA